MNSMRLFYENTDITETVKIHEAIFWDCIGHEADRLKLVFSDTEGLWSSWRPAKGDRLVLKDSHFSTGVMYIDQITKYSGTYALEAVSVPLSARNKKTQSWQNMRLFRLAEDLSSRNSLSLKVYGAQNHLYDSITQFEESDLAFLNRVCCREGYVLKVTDGSIVLYDEKQLEASPATELDLQNVGEDYLFTRQTVGMYSIGIVKYFSFSGEYTEYRAQDNAVTSGCILERVERVSSQAEAERWAKGYLWHANKMEYQGCFNIPFESSYSAGTVLGITELSPSKYLIHRITHDFVKQRSTVYVRGCR